MPLHTDLSDESYIAEHGILLMTDAFAKGVFLWDQYRF